MAWILYHVVGSLITMETVLSSTAKYGFELECGSDMVRGFVISETMLWFLCPLM